MQGKVKWFNNQEGYGWIMADDSKEYAFNVRDILNNKIPKNNERVNFKTRLTKKGTTRAVEVFILEEVIAGSSSSAIAWHQTAYENDRKASGRSANKVRDYEHDNDRTECHHCHKRIIPYVITKHGVEQRSICRFCGKTHKEFIGAYIETVIVIVIVIIVAAIFLASHDSA